MMLFALIPEMFLKYTNYLDNVSICSWNLDTIRFIPSHNIRFTNASFFNELSVQIC